MGKSPPLVVFLFAYVIFMSFCYIYHFCMPEYLMGKRLLHADVGPMRPADYARNRHRPRPEAMRLPPLGEQQ
jgi:hypothetical protein